MNSKAHSGSRPFVIDPAYSAEKTMPEPAKPVSPFSWLCGIREYSFFLHGKMREDIRRAKLKVGYPGEYMSASRSGCFRSDYPGGPGSFRCCGTPEVFLNGEKIELEAAKEEFRFTCPPGRIEIRIHSETIPALLPRWTADWQYRRESAPGEPFTEVEAFPDTGCAPHLLPPARMTLPLKPAGDGLYDAGCEIFGTVHLRHASPDSRINMGETIAEACNENPAFLEQDAALVPGKDGEFRTGEPGAFRYVRLIPAQPDAELQVEAVFTPLRYQGAFSCPDGELNSIWMRAAYTLRLCSMNFLLDGVKRDRLPWSGDLRITLLSDAFVFGEPSIIRHTLEVLGGAGIRKSHVNGITDYSLWYIINHDTFQLYFHDPDFLAQEYEKIAGVMEVLAGQEDEEGFLPLSGWVLIDWGAPDRDAPLQILYAAALRAAVRLADRMNDAVRGDLWRRKEERLRARIMKTFYDPEKKLFRGERGKTHFSRHANFLAVFAGFPVEPEPVASFLLGDSVPPAETLYMETMELSALVRLGKRKEACEKLKRDWGVMLKDGATTFYEAVIRPSEPDDKRHSFYNRKFGLSLCHAWSSGPVFLLPEIFFGIRPLSDGWQDFTAGVCYAPFDEMSLCLPVPQGKIELEYRRGDVLKIRAPAGLRHHPPA